MRHRFYVDSSEISLLVDGARCEKGKAPATRGTQVEKNEIQIE
jgi:hypothetical protein